MSIDFTLGIIYFIFFFIINFLFFIFLKNIFLKIQAFQKFLLFLSTASTKKKNRLGFLYFFKFSEIKNFIGFLSAFQKMSRKQYIQDIFLLKNIRTIFKGYYFDLLEKQISNL